MALCALIAVATLEGWPEKLRAADAQADDLGRRRSRVEVLYAAGDLPGALREALAGLRDHADDPVLARRAGQLALALRIPDVAEREAARLASALPAATAEGPDPRWWERESQALSAGARALRARETEMRRDVARARTTSILLLGTIVAGMLGLGRTGTQKKPPPSGTRRRAAE